MRRKLMRFSAAIFAFIFVAASVAGGVPAKAGDISGADSISAKSENRETTAADDIYAGSENRDILGEDCISAESDGDSEDSSDEVKKEFVWVVPHSTYSDVIKARPMLDLINDFRSGDEAWYRSASGEKVNAGKLDKLQYDYELETLAVSRAMEVAIYCCHVRINSHKTITEEGLAQGENITCGTQVDTYEKAMEDLKETEFGYDGQAHRRTMLGNFKSFAVGHVEIAGIHYWVQLFRINEPSKDQTPWEELAGSDPGAGLDMSGYVRYDSLGEITISKPDDPIVIKSGETVDPPYDIQSLLHNKEAMMADFLYVPLKTDNVDYIFTIEDTSIAKLTGEKGDVNGVTLESFDKIETVSKGQTNLVITHPFGGKMYSKKIPLWVVNPVEDIEMETSLKMNKGDKLELNPKLIPEGADRDDLIYKKVSGYVTRTRRHYDSISGKQVETELVNDPNTVSLTEDGKVEALKDGWLVIDIYSRATGKKIKRIDINVGDVGTTVTDAEKTEYPFGDDGQSGDGHKSYYFSHTDSKNDENNNDICGKVNDSGQADEDSSDAEVVKAYKAELKTLSGAKGKIKAVFEKPDIKDVSYQVKYKRAGSGWIYENYQKPKFKIKKVSSKKKYKIKVRIVKTINGKEYFGKWSKTYSVKVK